MRHRSDLRPYQQRIITWLYEHDSGFCIARPGGGKTVSALTAGAELIADKVIRHMLVVAPKRVAHNVWPDEIMAWAHLGGLKYQVLSGPPKARLKQLHATHAFDITIIGIDLLGWLLGELENAQADSPLFDLLVIDEISKLRAPTGVRAKLMAKNAGRWKMIWGLSGTLRPNSAADLFMPARVVTRGQLWGRSFYAWRQKNFYPTDYQGYVWEPKPDAEQRLHAELAPWTVTLLDNELPQLPELSIIIDRVNLPSEARLRYTTMQRRLLSQVHDRMIVAANAAVATGKLAQIANGFLYDTDEGKDAVAVHDEKRQWAQDLIEDASGPTIFVYEYLEDLRMLQELIGPTLPYLGAGNSAVSHHTIGAWNRGELPFLALHPAAGGHGLNLQHGGCDMAWISPTWSPEMWEQTIARLHRSGQQRPVIVRVCVADRTVDELKLDRVHHKIAAQEAFEAYLRRQQEKIG